MATAQKPSVLEENAVKKEAAAVYREWVMGLFAHCEDVGLKLVTHGDVDNAVVHYMNRLFFEGYELGQARSC